MEGARRARLFFHLALGGILVPCIGLPLAWTLALVLRSEKDPSAEQRRWTRRLLVLAVVDSLLVALLIGLVGTSELRQAEGLPSAPKRMVGLHLEPGSSPPQVGRVTKEGPAARAGVEVGDRVVTVDGEPVSTVAQLLQRVRGGEPGESLHLGLERGGRALEVEVKTLPIVERGLFEPAPGEQCEWRADRSSSLLLPGLGALVVLGLYWFGRRRGMDATMVYAAVALVAVSLGASAAAAWTCEALGGPSRGGFLLALQAQTLLLLGFGLWLWRRSRRAGFGLTPPDAPLLPWGRCALLGGMYMLAGAMRLGVLLLVANKVLGAEGSPGAFDASPIHELATSQLGPLGIVLFILPVVLLGPLAEELVFRGAVLPWLRAWMSEPAALVLSAGLFAVLHLYYGPFVVIILWYGVVLGWTRLRSGGLRAPVALHVTVNGVAAAVMLLRAAQ